MTNWLKVIFNNVPSLSPEVMALYRSVVDWCSSNFCCRFYIGFSSNRFAFYVNIFDRNIGNPIIWGIAKTSTDVCNRTKVLIQEKKNYNLPVNASRKWSRFRFVLHNMLTYAVYTLRKDASALRRNLVQGCMPNYATGRPLAMSFSFLSGDLKKLHAFHWFSDVSKISLFGDWKQKKIKNTTWTD